VIQPVIMPKPDLIPLTGGYRRIPVMQIGADVYCDSQVILAELEARHPDPPVVQPGDWAVNLWADRLWFGATVAVVFGEIGENVPAEFIADREKLSGRPFDIAAMKAAAGPMKAQWTAHAATIERGLMGGSDFLGGARASLADVAAYMNVWWLTGAARAQADKLLASLPRTRAWAQRMRAIGHGRRSEMTPAEALAAARRAEPAPSPDHDADDPSGLSPGEEVAVMADDYGRDPIRGMLVAAAPDRIVIQREVSELGWVNVHFPRLGYVLAPAAPE
jgi:glutathione S-transferase